MERFSSHSEICRWSHREIWRDLRWRYLGGYLIFGVEIAGAPNVCFLYNYGSSSNEFPTIFWSLIFHISLLRLGYFSQKKEISTSKSGCWSSLLGDEGWASWSSALKLDGFWVGSLVDGSGICVSCWFLPWCFKTWLLPGVVHIERSNLWEL